MKMCMSCKREKHQSKFTKDKNRSDGLHIYCKDCVRRKYGELARLRTAKLRVFQRKKIANLKRSLGCKFCAETEPVCLEFHHLDPSVKEYTIGQSSTCNMEKLLKEINTKCICVCSNCHRKVHAGII